MFDLKKKNIVIGIVGFIISLGLTILFILLSPEGNITDLDEVGTFYRIMSIVSVVSCVSFLGFIFFGIRGFLYFFVPISIFAILKIISMYMNKINDNLFYWFIILIILVVSWIFILRSYYKLKAYLKDDKADNLEDNLIENEDEDIYKEGDIEYIIIVSNVLEKWYQLIKYDNKLYFHYLKTGIFRKNNTKLIENIEDLYTFSKNKNDFIISMNEIETIKVWENRANDFISNGNIKFKFKDKKSKTYSYVGNYNFDSLKSFLGSKATFKPKKVIKEEHVKLSEKRKKILGRLNVFKCIYSFVISFLIATAFIVYRKDVYFIVNLLILIFLTILPFIYIKFNKYIYISYKRYYIKPLREGKMSFFDIKFNKYIYISYKRYYVKPLREGKMSFFDLFLIPLLFLLVNYMLDFEYYIKYDYLKLFLFILIPLTILLILFFVFTKEYKKYKNSLIPIIFYSIVYSFCLIYSIDSNFDLSNGAVKTLEVIKKDTHTNNSNEVTYYFYVDYNNEELRVEVSESTYKMNNEIEVIVKDGLLGINKVIYYDSYL